MRHDPGKGWTNYQTVYVEPRSLSLSLMQECLSNSSVLNNLQAPLCFLSKVHSLERPLGITTQVSQVSQLLSNTSGLVLSDLWSLHCTHTADESQQQSPALGSKRDGQRQPWECDPFKVFFPSQRRPKSSLTCSLNFSLLIKSFTVKSVHWE